MKGRFISFEGVDGAGKSTHIGSVKHTLEAMGKKVLVTREPGGTAVGEALRELVLHEDMSAKMELMLMYAARMQHIDQLILPALQKGVWVLSDRFEDSSYAYQVSAGGASTADFQLISQWALRGFQPDLTLLFDLPVAVSKQRIAIRAESTDRFEARPDSYFEAVRAGFLSRASASKGRIVVINADQPESEVGLAVASALAQCLDVSSNA